MRHRLALKKKQFVVHQSKNNSDCADIFWLNVINVCAGDIAGCALNTLNLCRIRSCFNVRLTANSRVSQKNVIDICELDKEVDYVIRKQNVAEAQLDDLKQYGRGENLEIHGVPLKRDENTNEIVKSVASSLNVRLDDHQISTSHRLAGSYKKIQGNQATEQLPPIIVRFANRDKRKEIYKKRKLLKLNCETEPMSRNSSPNITIQENLTPLRKSVYKAAKQAKAALNFKFAWTSQRKIFLRQDTDTKVYKILSFHDLAKLGYSGAGEKISRFLV